MAGDDVHRLARNSDLLAAGRVNQGKLGDCRNLAQEPKRLQPTLLDIASTPRQLRCPAHLALDLFDELVDLRGCGIRLLALNADQERLLLTIGKPDVEKAIGDEGGRHDARKQQDVFPKQPPARADPPSWS